MARLFTGSSNQYVTIPNVPNLTTRATFGCWFRKSSIPPTDDSEYHTIFSKGRSNYNEYVNLAVDHGSRGGAEGLRVWFVQNYNVHHIRISASGLVKVGRWYQLIACVDWTTNPDTVALYLDGVPLDLTLTDGSGNATPSTSATQIVRLGHNTVAGAPTKYRFKGDLAETWLLSETVTPNEAFALGTGRMSPDMLRRAYTGLEFYLPLRGYGHDLWRGRDGTLTGCALSDHPPVDRVRDAQRSYFLFGSAAGPETHFGRAIL